MKMEVNIEKSKTIIINEKGRNGDQLTYRGSEI